MLDKHAECRIQFNAERCSSVDAKQQSSELGSEVTIPEGNSSISLYVALSVSVGGTLLFVIVLAVVWKVVRGKNSKGKGKLKKGDRKGSGKGEQNTELCCLPWFSRFSLGGKGMNGKGKGNALNEQRG